MNYTRYPNLLKTHSYGNAVNKFFNIVINISWLHKYRKYRGKKLINLTYSYIVNKFPSFSTIAYKLSKLFKYRKQADHNILNIRKQITFSKFCKYILQIFLIS